jgi:4-hydroxy-tetrahydrodipicolinate synthase
MYIDVFDVAYKYGIRMNLDSMFSCTAPIAAKVYESLENNNYEVGAKYLDRILDLRREFAKVGLFRGFNYAMNLLGYEGIFSSDYVKKASDKYESGFEKIKNLMHNLQLI